METLDVLIAARAEVVKGWCRGWAASPEGNVCALGAIGLVVGGVSRAKPMVSFSCVHPAAHHLRANAPGGSAAAINDAPSTTKADVLALFDRAINSLVPVGDESHVHRVAA